MAADDVEMAPSAAPRTTHAEFENLFATKMVHQVGAAQHEEVDAMQVTLDELQREYMEKQVTQNVMEKLMQVDREDDLRAMLSAQERVEADYKKRRAELDAIVTERRLHIAKIAEYVDEIEREKENVAKRDQSRPEFESELQKLQAQWKELQKRNAQRKAAIQMATGMMLNNEEDCNRVLENQTQEIQELHEKQKRLEEKKIDLTTRVKQTSVTITTLEKQNDILSRDLQTKQREEEFGALRHMKEWYQNINQLLASLTGIDITHITDEFMELCVLKSHSLRLFFDPHSTQLRHVECLQSDVDARDLIEIAIRTNDIQFLASEYRERIAQAHQ